MMSSNVLIADALTQMTRHALGKSARIHEYERVLCSLMSWASRSYTSSHTSPDITACRGDSGTSIARSSLRVCPRINNCAVWLTIRIDSAEPTRKRATSSIGRCVADKPMRISLEFRIRSFGLRISYLWLRLTDQLFKALN